MRGIMFLPEMFGAAEAGNKTETSRFGGLQAVNDRKAPAILLSTYYRLDKGNRLFARMESKNIVTPGFTSFELLSHYKLGEILFVKEPWVKQDTRAWVPTGIWGDALTRRNKMFMPKEAARRWIRITGIRIRQVQVLTDAEYMAEGLLRGYNYRQETTGYGWHEYTGNTRTFKSFPSFKDAWQTLIDNAGKKGNLR